jgi:hypothetical protein
MSKIDHKTVNSFYDEWTRFDQTRMLNYEVMMRFEECSDVFYWTEID